MAKQKKSSSENFNTNEKDLPVLEEELTEPALPDDEQKDLSEKSTSIKNSNDSSTENEEKESLEESNEKESDKEESAEEISDSTKDSVKKLSLETASKKDKKESLNPKTTKKKDYDKGKSRRKITRRVSTIITLVVTIIVVVLNVIMSVLSNNNPLRMDLTLGKVYDLDVSTQQYLTDLDTDVEIIVLTAETSFTQDLDSGGYFPQLNAILRGMESANPHIQLSYVEDFQNNPEISERFSNLTLSAGDILVVHDDRKIQLSVTDLFNTQEQTDTSTNTVGIYITSSRAEQALLTAIFTVVNDVATTVTFLTDTDGTDTSALQNLFTINGYTVEEGSLLGNSWSEETDVLVLCGPKEDLTEEQIAGISGFLEQTDKTLLYFAPQTPTGSLTNLNAFLADWGLSIGENFVYENDATNYLAGSDGKAHPFVPYAEYSEDAFGASLADEDGKRVLLPLCHPIDLLYTSNGSRSTAPLLTFLDTSSSYSVNSSDDESISAGPRGPFNGAAYSTRRFDSADGFDLSQIVAFGSEQAIAADYLSTTLTDNSAYFIRLLKSLYSDSAPSLVIEDKVIDPAQLDISSSQQKGLGLVFMGIIPVVVVMGGIFERVRRNRL